MKEIYASLGILKTGHVIKVDRKKLVGQYIGDTEENTKRALQQAHGNILFVDEALIARTLAELDALTGREEIKRTIHDLVTLARTRQQSGDELAYTIPLHWTFTGATGTGKTTVAGLLAQLRVLETQKSSISTAKNEPVEITIDDLSSVKWKEVHNPKIGF